MSQLTVKRITVKDGSTVITSEDLAKSLDQDPAVTIQALSKQFAQIQKDEISIDDSGRVVVTNAEFSRVLKDHFTPPGGVAAGILVDNLGCGCELNLFC